MTIDKIIISNPCVICLLLCIIKSHPQWVTFMYVPALDTLLRGVRGSVLVTNRRKLSMIAALFVRLKVAKHLNTGSDYRPWSRQTHWTVLLSLPSPHTDRLQSLRKATCRVPSKSNLMFKSVCRDNCKPYWHSRTRTDNSRILTTVFPLNYIPTWRSYLRALFLGYLHITLAIRMLLPMPLEWHCPTHVSIPQKSG